MSIIAGNILIKSSGILYMGKEIFYTTKKQTC